MVCTECGKVRNRIEDFYNLSLPVKDIKSMEESLKKMIEGETISDYLCDGCNKKVDISRRTLISQTPNVLIVHLQRIIFNFDTFRNDKINSFWEFPYQLDLKPYSFFEVMKNEQRLNQEKGDDDQDEQKQEVPVEEDSQWPEEEDCFEYKLVGVNVHSGTANAGHYWSYINTLRGFTEPDEKDANWDKTENEPWMEFNDSTVKDFKFEKLKDDCFGGEKKSAEVGAFSFGDSSYGKSAYMLVYERKKKKPIKILLMGDELEEEKKGSSQIQFDEKKEEHYKLIDYRDGVEEITPNQIYKQVMEDNMKFEFENDIYSQEFFDFVHGIIKAVTTLVTSNKEKSELVKNCTLNVMKIGKKAILEIVAKCFHNRSITAMMLSFVDLFKQDESLCEMFLKHCQEEDDFDYLFTLLLECSDVQARSAIGLLMKHIIITLKLRDKDILYEKDEVEVTGSDGSKATAQVPRSILIVFIEKCLKNLNTRVAKHWLKFETFLDLLSFFALGDTEYKPGEDEAENNRQKELTAIGLEYCFREHFV